MGGAWWERERASGGHALGLLLLQLGNRREDFGHYLVESDSVSLALSALALALVHSSYHLLAHFLSVFSCRIASAM